MANPNTITIDGKEIAVGRGVEFRAGILRGPNSDVFGQVLKALSPKVEGQIETHKVVFNGEELPDSFLILTTPVEGTATEG